MHGKSDCNLKYDFRVNIVMASTDSFTQVSIHTDFCDCFVSNAQRPIVQTTALLQSGLQCRSQKMTQYETWKLLCELRQTGGDRNGSCFTFFISPLINIPSFEVPVSNSNMYQSHTSCSNTTTTSYNTCIWWPEPMQINKQIRNSPFIKGLIWRDAKKAISSRNL